MAATAAAVVVRPVTPEQASLWSDAWRRLRRNRLALAGAIYLVFLVVVALVAFVHTPYPMAGVAVAQPYSGPSAEHWFGADSLGRDVLSRVMVGAQISLTVGIGTQLIVLAVGVPIGLAAGYFKGWLDSIVSFWTPTGRRPRSPRPRTPLRITHTLPRERLAASCSRSSGSRS